MRACHLNSYRICRRVLLHRTPSASVVTSPSFSAERHSFLFGESPKTFRSLNLDEGLCAGLEATEKSIATVIQASAFEPILAGKNVTLAAETGTGKTLAFMLPLLHMMLSRRDASGGTYPVAIVMVPNKELGNQGLQYACLS